MLEDGYATGAWSCGRCLHSMDRSNVRYNRPWRDDAGGEGVEFLCSSCADLYSEGYWNGKQAATKPQPAPSAPGEWQGGDSGCEHRNPAVVGLEFCTDYCGSCGARRINSQQPATGEDVTVLDPRYAVSLKVPRSGIPELDAMIRESRRWDVAVAAMQGLIDWGDNRTNPLASAAEAFLHADALLRKHTLLAEADKVKDPGYSRACNTPSEAGADEESRIYCKRHDCLKREHGEGGPTTVGCDECEEADDGVG